MRFFAQLIIFLILLAASFKPAHALSCLFYGDEINLTINQSSSVSFSVTNSGPEEAIAVKFTTDGPEYFQFSAGSANNWATPDINNGNLLFSGTAWPPETTYTFLGTLQGLAEPPEQIYSVGAFVSADGVNFDECSGGRGVVVSAASQTPVISNSSVTVGNSSATITWTTDVASSGRINYGTSTSYGSSATTTEGTSHSASISGLSSSTTYHFQIQTTGTSGTTTSNDATFTTTAASVTTTTTTTVTTQTVVTKVLRDSIAPTITINNDFSKTFMESPLITGTATDFGEVNAGVVSIDYSLDSGKNWLPVDTINGLGKRIGFEFTPGKLDDGNYAVKIRAKDATGNTGMSKVFSMVIDRLPPKVGGILYSIGPMVLLPDQNGTIYTLPGIDLNLTLSAVGGPVSIDLNLEKQETIKMQKNLESGLWKGVFNPSSSGSYSIDTSSIDGADNHTTRKLNVISVLSQGTVTDETNSPISNAKISVFGFEKTSNNYLFWDSQPYSQNNPIFTNQSGNYSIILPPGKYYLEVSATGKRKLRTEIFEVKFVSPINADFSMSNAGFFGKFLSKTISFNPSTQTQTKTQLTRKGESLPDFDLSQPNTEFSSTSVLGKPTILSFISTWEPQTSDQLHSLDSLKNNNQGINVYAVAIEESVSKIDVYKKIGGFSIPIVADPDGELVLSFDITTFPTHIFVDRKGVIQSTYTGFLDEEVLLEKILQ